MATQSHDEVVKKILDDLRDLRERLAESFDNRTDDTERNSDR